MKTNHLMTLTCLIIIGFLGCSKPTKSATDAKNQAEAGGIKTQDNVIPNIEDGKPIELPANYQNQFSSVKPAVLVTFSKIEMRGQVLKGIEKGLDSMLEAKLSRMGRFNIISKFGNEAVALAKDLADLGEVDPSNIEAVEPPKIDLFFTCEALISKRNFERADGTDRTVYTVDILLDMMDVNKRAIGMPVRFTGKTEELKIIVGLDGKRIGGVTLENETQAIRDAITDCFTRISFALVNQFPITAQVVGISSFDTDRMLLDKGVMQGLVKGQLVVIWTSDGGIDIPLAEARVSPGENNSSIQITRWNDSSPGFKNFIKKIKSPGWLKQEGNKLFATTAGLPLPPEWKR